MTLFDRVVAQTSALAKKGDARLPRSPFGRVGVTEAAESAGDALVALALAGSLFFSLDPSAAKSKVLQYLLISLAPFVVVAPFIGPLVDRLGHARKWVLFGSLVTRALICLFMAGHLDSLLLFPEAFAVLVAGKTASVAKSALVPAVVPSDNELVRANARLSLISVFGGGVILPIGWVIRRYGEEGWVLRAAALVFMVASVVALRIRVRHERSGAPGSNESFTRVIADDGPVRVNALAMALLRGSVGCVMFAAVFALRSKPLWITGLTLGSLQVGTSVGAAIAERLRRRTHEARMILGAMVLVALVAGVAAIFPNLESGVAVAAAVGIAASTSRLAFDAIVQRSLPRHDFGAAFARYETRFQLSWVVGALVPTALVLPRAVGFGLVSAVMVFGIIVGLVGEPALDWIAAGLRWVTGQLRSVVNKISGGRMGDPTPAPSPVDSRAATPPRPSATAPTPPTVAPPKIEVRERRTVATSTTAPRFAPQWDDDPPARAPQPSPPPDADAAPQWRLPRMSITTRRPKKDGRSK